MINKDYKKHSVFKEIKYYSNFYNNLSGSIFGSISNVSEIISNIDSYTFSSMEGTLDSIHIILYKGRINDSYALLRKYYDLIIINIYSILYLKDNLKTENIILEEINNWVRGKERLPEIRKISQFIRNSNQLKILNDIFYRYDTYKKIRDHCNDHMHYNSFSNLILNDNNLFLEYRFRNLNTFSKDLKNLFILHFGYLFFLMDHYLVSSDYIDCLEMRIQPEIGMEYWVAPFIKKVFEEIIVKFNPELAEELKKSTNMLL